MAVIDEEGRLFGRVNVIDALVVLLALAVVGAGVALVAGGGDESSTKRQPTRNATLAIGPLPATDAGLVKSGTATLNGETVTVTDIYRAPKGNESVTVLATVVAPGEETDQGFTVGNWVLRYGASTALETTDYKLPATVRSVSKTTALDTKRVTVTVESKIPKALATAVNEGDAQVIAGEETARVIDVQRRSGDGERATVQVRLSVLARNTSNGYYYGDVPLRVGARLPFATTEYQFHGTVANVST